MIYVVMGVSGCGKSSVGSLLSEKLSLPFFDADDFHPESNVNKMKLGIPLNDDDRHPWLVTLASNICQWQQSGGAVLACSALKQAYRDILSSSTQDAVEFIYLRGEKKVLLSRINARADHFMPSSLLDSQLSALEPPTKAITVSIEQPLETMIDAIIKEIRQ